VCATGAVHTDMFRSIRYLPNPVRRGALNPVTRPVRQNSYIPPNRITRAAKRRRWRCMPSSLSKHLWVQAVSSASQKLCATAGHIGTDHSAQPRRRIARRVKSSRRGPAPAKARRSSRQAVISSAGGRAACWRTKVMTRSTPYSSPSLRASERPSV